ncbi:MAG: WecB/TagA/CpsF family glycosyltransferase [Aridibacter sp.]
MSATQIKKEENQLSESKRVRVVSLLVNVCNYKTAIEKIIELVRAGNGGYVCFSTVHMIMESYDNPEYGDKVNSANMIIPDGMPLVWMQKLQGVREADRVRANSIMRMLLEHTGKNNLSVGFYGGKQEVIDEIQVKAKQEFPNLEIAYACSPPFRPLTEEEDSRITAEINRTKPDILFMGLGCPKQENWMFAHKNEVKAIMLGVGASFDFYAGNVKECPEWLQKLGLEWLFRLTQEPRRLWRRYLILNPRFMWLAGLQLLGFKRFKI